MIVGLSQPPRTACANESILFYYGWVTISIISVLIGAHRFFNRVRVKMNLTLEEVRRVRFRMARRGATGYEVGDVDTFIDKVEESFAQPIIRI